VQQGTAARQQERRVISRQMQQQEVQGRRRQERMRDEGLELEELERLLSQARGQCPSCALEGVGSRDHALFWCQERSSEYARTAYRTMKEAIRRGRTMEAYSGCMDCFLPQAWCRRWEQAEGCGGLYRRKAGARCQFPDVVLSGWVVAMTRAEVMEAVEGRMTEKGYDMGQQEEVLGYLGRKRMWAGLETSELLREYYLAHRR
jgi:hypothetical protein